MYFGNRHTSSVTVSEIRIYDCKNCRNKSTAQVTGIGVGRGNSAYFLDESGASNRAQSRAGRAAQKNIEQTIKIARCPHCHQRNSGNVLNFWLYQLGLKVVLPIVGYILLASLIYSFHSDEMVYWIFGIAALVALPLMYFTDIHWRWFSADKRVVYVDTEAGKIIDEILSKSRESEDGDDWRNGGHVDY